MPVRIQPLDERINQLRADIDAFIDERVAQIKKDSPGVPEGVIRQMETWRSGGCQCESYLWIKQNDDAAEEDAA